MARLARGWHPVDVGQKALRFYRVPAQVIARMGPRRRAPPG
jgi:hypothetical protein